MFRNILLAVDGAEPGQLGTSLAVALARQNDATVEVLHVNEFLFGGRGLTTETPAEATAVVAEAVAELREAGVRATGTICRTTCFGVAPAIVDIAHQHRADAIVLGSHRRRGLARLRSHGVRERVTRLTVLPVLMAPSPLAVTGRRGRRARRADLPGGLDRGRPTVTFGGPARPPTHPSHPAGNGPTNGDR